MVLVLVQAQQSYHEAARYADAAIDKDDRIRTKMKKSNRISEKTWLEHAVLPDHLRFELRVKRFVDSFIPVFLLVCLCVCLFECPFVVLSVCLPVTVHVCDCLYSCLARALSTLTCCCRSYAALCLLFLMAESDVLSQAPTVHIDRANASKYGR